MIIANNQNGQSHEPSYPPLKESLASCSTSTILFKHHPGQFASEPLHNQEMAALVSTFPQQSTVTMMHNGPSSSSDRFSPAQPQQFQSSRNSQQRYNMPANSGSYRGMPSHGPVQPYAFTSTPQLTSPGNNQRQYQTPHLRNENRTASAPIVPSVQQHVSMPGGPILAARQRHPSSSQLSASSSATSLQTQYTPRSLDDTSISSKSALSDSSNRPQSTIGIPASSSVTSAGSMSPAKSTPDRYRRNVRRVDLNDNGQNRTQHASAMPSGSGMATVGHLYNHPGQSTSSPTLQTYQSYRGSVYNAGDQTRKASADDMNLGKSQNVELAKRHRRRSLGSLETTAGVNHAEDVQDTPTPHPNAFMQSTSPLLDLTDPRQSKPSSRPQSSHAHHGSSESVSSARSAQSSRPTSAKHESSSNVNNPQPAPQHFTQVSKQEVKVVNVPARTNEISRRSTNPSPLSRPTNMGQDAPAIATTEPVAGPSQAPVVESPATQQLTAVSQKDAKKSKSKLRRAFSFGSSSELQRATAKNNMERNTMADPAAKRRSKYEDELEPEQARIAQKQEAGGLGESIYSGQGNFFTGSTDNLSISSTASSASIMLRKMGKGVKKSTRSLVGLFRPKSVMGVPAADGPVNQASAAQVSMVTVEAEREKVNVNVNPHDQAGGGTGFPRLERNSIDAKHSVDSGTVSTDSRSRRSIVGGERERAEVLAAVKKGILKRNDSSQSSPIAKPVDYRSPDFNLPQIPHVNDSPHSSAPSTPRDDQPPRSGHRRTDSITIEGNESEDYFNSITQFANVEPKNILSPQNTVSRNISFSPRIQFHDTWTANDYDRRGEIATCNRLTPMLAQQIKEELNTFKMVCHQKL